MFSILKWILYFKEYIRNCKKVFYWERKKLERINVCDVKIFIYFFNVVKILKIVKGIIGNEGLMMKKVLIIFVFDV